MHILIIPSEEFVPVYDPTAGIFQYHQAAILKESGHKVGVISVRQSFSLPMIGKAVLYKTIGRRSNNLADQYSLASLIGLGYKKMVKPLSFLTTEEKEGINVLRIDGFYYLKPSVRTNHYGWVKAGQTAFKEYIKKYGKPDVIHAHNALYAGILAQKIKKEYSIPYIITEHSTAFARNLVVDKKILNLVSKAYRHSNGLFAVSEPFCNLLNKQFDIDRFKCLPNVLDPFLEEKEINEKAQNDAAFIFINIAELHPKKDHVSLIRAFKKIINTGHNAMLYIGGNGELSDELQALVNKEALEGSVKFLGLLSREQVGDHLQNSDCFVLSSKFETFGVVVIEAMLFGKPVIVTKCGGPEDFVTPESGLVIEKENENSLAEAMIYMINNHSQYKPHIIRQDTINRFGKRIFLQRIDEIYKKRSMNKEDKPLEYRQCSLSIMDTISDPDITFDEKGICQYYYQYLNAEKEHVKTGKEGRRLLEQKVDEIKKAGKGKPYDCIMGLSGGVDSSYVALLTKEYGLRPLPIHFDNGWNSELAVNNISNIVNKLGLDLYTLVVDWEEFKDVQLSYLKASVVDIEVVSDHAIEAATWKLCLQHGIKYVLSGTNIYTEFVMPRSWIFNKRDHLNLKAIHNKYGSKKLKTYPLNDTLLKKRSDLAGITQFNILNYVDYNKQQAKETITKELSWRDYGGKHYESLFTKIYQAYILPEKFKIDKRKPHLSSLIFSGQMTKEEALKEMEKPLYTPETLKTEKEFFLKKLGLSAAEWENIMNTPPRSHTEFPVERPLDERYKILKPAKFVYHKLRGGK